MATFKERKEIFFGEAITLVIGWSTGIVLLGGAFALGRWTAPLLWNGNPDVFGLLSAVVVLWFYEHRHFEERFDRLEERLQKLWEAEQDRLH
jgi:hypothetical protein